MKRKIQQFALWLFLIAASAETFAGVWACNTSIPMIVFVWAIGAGLGGFQAPLRGDIPAYSVSGGLVSLFVYFAFWFTPFARLISS